MSSNPARRPAVADPAGLSAALADEPATIALGRRLARALRPGDTVLLAGDLGAGKSTLARSIIRARAGAAIDVPSPTFTLVQTYDLPGGEVWHFDLYRLGAADEVWELGWEEAAGMAIVLVEWPDRLGPLTPADRLDILLETEPESPGRRATLTATGPGARATLRALSEAAP